jgi:hypothetical protein
VIAPVLPQECVPAILKLLLTACVLMLVAQLSLMLPLLLLLLLLLLPQVAGSARGVSAFQMDIKVEGITLDIMRQVRTGYQ